MWRPKAKNKKPNDLDMWFLFKAATVSPCPDARRLHRINQEAAEAAALHDVQGVDRGAPWWAHVVLQLAGVLLRVQQHLSSSLKGNGNMRAGLRKQRDKGFIRGTTKLFTAAQSWVTDSNSCAIQWNVVVNANTDKTHLGNWILPDVS